MGRVLVVVALSLLLWFPLPQVEAANWEKVVRRVSPSVITLACSGHGKTGCTAFSINEREGYYLTAAHCKEVLEEQTAGEETATAFGKPLEVVYLSSYTEGLDLIVFKAEEKRPALRLRSVGYSLGLQVGSLGYGLGMPGAMFRTAYVSLILQNEAGTRYSWFDNTLVQGMSGGPIFDADGRLVGINQQTDLANGMGLSVSLSTIREAVGKYFE